MSRREENEYILGTDPAELTRLGLQHRIWAEEAQKGWRKAGFTAGNTLLDLGCGPGFCSTELAYIAGSTGSVIAIDKSQQFINYLNSLGNFHQLNIEAIAADFNDMSLGKHSLDGMYCRWALAWISNPKEILLKVHEALKPGGKMVIHEYYDWSTHQTEPALPNLGHAIKQCYKSFKEREGDIDIGRHLPKLLSELGMKISSVRLMPKLATPDNIIWQWPKSFYNIYFYRLEEMGYLTNEQVSSALADLNQLENTPGSTLFCPILIEIIAEKI